MSPDGEVTHWLRRFEAGDPGAIQALWHIYFARLVGLARQRLRGVARRAANEEDVALSAFDSFFRRAGEGGFPRLDDRDDLWNVLGMITKRKAADLANHERRKKRGGGAVVAASEMGDEAAFAELLSREPDPALAAELTESLRNFRRLFR